MRSVLLFALILMTLRCSVAFAAPSGKTDADRLYIVLYDHSDWHGGRMTFSAIQQRFYEHKEVLDEYPQLKIGYQYGSSHYDWLSSGPPMVCDFLEEFKQEFQKLYAEGRTGIAGPPFVQALSALMPEETAIREFVYGVEGAKEHFGYESKIYAFSENTGWAFLPQILVDLGYKGAVMRTHHQPAGFPPTYDASMVYWKGPDGSMIPTIPTYGMDNQSQAHGGMNRGEHDLIYFKDLEKLNEYYDDKKAQGVEYVVLTVVEDTLLGAVAEGIMPQIQKVDPEGERYKFVTLEELFDIIPPPAQDEVLEVWPRDWSFRLNAGYLGDLISIMTNRLNALFTDTETLISLLYLVERDGTRDYADELKAAWKQFLSAQAHDSYLVPETGPLAFKQMTQAEAMVAPIKEEVLSSLASKIAAEHDGQSIVVYNTLNFQRREPVMLEVSLATGTYIRDLVEAESGKSVPFDITEIRKEDNADRVSLVFVAEAPAMGYNTYNLLLRQGEQKTTLQVSAQGKAVKLENAYFFLDVNKAGEIQGLSLKDGTSILSTGRLEASSHFTANIYPLDNPTKGKQYRSSGEVVSIETGNVVFRVIAKGKLEEQGYKHVTTIYKDLPYVDFYTEFQFTAGIGVGEPVTHPAHAWGEVNENTRRKRLTVNFRPAFQLARSLIPRDPHSTSYPLFNARKFNEATNISRYTPFIPETYERKAAFVTLETYPEQYRNHIYNIESRYWLDISDTDGSRGFILLNQGTGAHVYDGNLLSMVLAQGSQYVPLYGHRNHYSAIEAPYREGRYSWSYRIIPHKQKISDVRYELNDYSIDSHREGISFNNPLIVQVVEGVAGHLPPKFSFISVPENGVMISTLKLEGDAIYLRLYEYEGKGHGEVTVSSPLYEGFSIVPVSLNFHEDRPESYLELTPYRIGTYRMVPEEQ